VEPAVYILTCHLPPMEAQGYSETSARVYHTTCCQFPVGSQIQAFFRNNVKSVRENWSQFNFSKRGR
jgi:hypothetical protein